MRTAQTALLVTLCCAAFFWVAAPPASAQFRGAIEGTVLDTSGGVIPGAGVTLTNNETKRTQRVATSAEGFYHFVGLAPGLYTVEASAKGMRTGTVKDIPLAPEGTTGINITLQAGDVSETVTVSSDTVAPLRRSRSSSR